MSQSPNPKTEIQAPDNSIIVSRSHAGGVGDVAKKGLGDDVTVIPAGGAGKITLHFCSRLNFVLRIQGMGSLRRYRTGLRSHYTDQKVGYLPW